MTELFGWKNQERQSLGELTWNKPGKNSRIWFTTAFSTVLDRNGRKKSIVFHLSEKDGGILEPWCLEYGWKVDSVSDGGSYWL